MAYKRPGSDYWYYDVTDAAGKRRRKSTKIKDTGPKSQKQAEQLENNKRGAAALGEVLEDICLREACEKWWAARGQFKKSATTIATRLEIMRRCLDETRLISTLDTNDVEDAMIKRRAETTRRGKLPADSTVNNEVPHLLRPILKYAQRNLKQTVRNIDWRAVTLPISNERVREFTPEELIRYEAELAHWHLSLARFYRRYGLRLCEAFFSISTINTETWRIAIAGDDRKNGKPHIVPLMPDDAKEIAARLGVAREAGIDTVWFRRMKSGEVRALTPKAFQQASTAALNRAGIVGARPCHDFRHHAGTTLMRKVGNLKVVQTLLGHENIRSTARYAHANTDDVEEALRHTYGTVDTPPPQNPKETKAV